MKVNKNFKNITINHQQINQVKEQEAKWMIKRTHFIHYKKEYQ